MGGAPLCTDHARGVAHAWRTARCGVERRSFAHAAAPPMRMRRKQVVCVRAAPISAYVLEGGGVASSDPPCPFEGRRVPDEYFRRGLRRRRRAIDQDSIVNVDE